MNETIRWGIMGPGGIAKNFTSELQHAKYTKVQAVGSRSLERAAAFAENFDIPNVHGSYEELAADPDVDIIYVSTPHPQHCESVLMCLRAGKAVLCEKPFTINARESQEMIDMARDRKLFLMEAMWSRFLPALQKAKSWMDQGEIGETKMLKANFGLKFRWEPEHRLLNKELGGGALLDAGIYPVSIASWVFGSQPKSIKSSAHIGSTGVDEWNSMVFDYEGGCMASLESSIQLKFKPEVHIFGTEGNIHIPIFPNSKTAILTRHGQSEVVFTDTTEPRGMVHQAEEAMRCLRKGLLESPVMPLDETLANMDTLDRIRAQWNLTYSADHNKS